MTFEQIKAARRALAFQRDLASIVKWLTCYKFGEN